MPFNTVQRLLQENKNKTELKSALEKISFIDNISDQDNEFLINLGYYFKNFTDNEIIEILNIEDPQKNNLVTHIIIYGDDNAINALLELLFKLSENENNHANVLNFLNRSAVQSNFSAAAGEHHRKHETYLPGVVADAVVRSGLRTGRSITEETNTTFLKILANLSVYPRNIDTIIKIFEFRYQPLRYQPSARNYLQNMMSSGCRFEYKLFVFSGIFENMKLLISKSEAKDKEQNARRLLHILISEFDIDAMNYRLISFFLDRNILQHKFRLINLLNELILNANLNPSIPNDKQALSELTRCEVPEAGYRLKDQEFLQRRLILGVEHAARLYGGSQYDSQLRYSYMKCLFFAFNIAEEQNKKAILERLRVSYLEPCINYIKQAFFAEHTLDVNHVLSILQNLIETQKLPKPNQLRYMVGEIYLGYKKDYQKSFDYFELIDISDYKSGEIELLDLSVSYLKLFNYYLNLNEKNNFEKTGESLALAQQCYHKYVEGNPEKEEEHQKRNLKDARKDFCKKVFSKKYKPKFFSAKAFDDALYEILSSENISEYYQTSSFKKFIQDPRALTTTSPFCLISLAKMSNVIGLNLGQTEVLYQRAKICARDGRTLEENKQYVDEALRVPAP